MLSERRSLVVENHALRGVCYSWCMYIGAGTILLIILIILLIAYVF